MESMFEGCGSLRNLDLSNFNMENAITSDNIFSLCRLLKKENIITQDDKILSKFS